MRYTFLSCFFLASFFYGHAQGSKIDSLSKQLAKEKMDTNRVTLLWRLAEQYQSFKPDTAMQLAQQALFLARRIKYIEGESRSLAMLAQSQYLLGNYPRALNNYMLKLKIEEKRNSPRNYASALGNIGLMYILLGEYSNALSYLYRADSTVETAGEKAKNELKFNFLINIGEAYYRMHKLDSAEVYFGNSLSLANQKNDDFAKGVSMLGLANVKALRENGQVALQYYYGAFTYLNDGQSNDFICETTLGMAKVYSKLNRQDSAAYFGKMSFSIAKRDGFLSRELDAASFLSQYFKKYRDFDSAFTYIELATNLKDSIKGQDKTKETMIISANEQLRQAELAEQKLREKRTRKQQLQLLLIAIFIPLFFIMTLFISRIKIHTGIIKFMGIISLLILFEYLTLLLHPFVADLTNHTPLLELMIFVILAMGIIPLHHRLEHLLISRLTKGKPGLSGKFLKTKTVKIKIKK
jgi:tetratricopeptide (TPR) repeat protein